MLGEDHGGGPESKEFDEKEFDGKIKK